MKKYQDVNKVAFLGIGGGGVYYTAKFFHALGTEVYGFDIKENEKVLDLQQSGVQVSLNNPTESFDDGTDLYIYSDALPQKIKDQIKNLNPGLKSIEVGAFFDQLTQDFENEKLSAKETDAFHDSNLAPLYSIDTSLMKYIGVTGTDGKTTTSTMLYHILNDQGFKPALISTVSAKIGDKEISTGFHVTTPSAQMMYNLIKRIEAEKCTHIIIEATSHGLSMGRLAGLKFDLAVYTNITEEHLDYHGTYESLREAKGRLITRHLKKDGMAILNHDDQRSYNYLKAFSPSTLSYSQEDCASEECIVAKEIKANTEGFEFKVNGIDTKLNILGQYNISNALAAIGTATKLRVSLEKASGSLESFQTVSGRMEVVQTEPFRVIVDFAHTPNALKNVLQTTKSQFPDGKLILVFGCAGQRDPSKREVMGRYAGEYADITHLTAEDPRFEKLEDINKEIEKGWKQTSKGKQRELQLFNDDQHNVEVRRDAISSALKKAQSGDTVLIAGKGHEGSLCFGNKDYEWNDIEEVKKLLNKLP